METMKGVWSNICTVSFIKEGVTSVNIVPYKKGRGLFSISGCVPLVLLKGAWPLYQ